MLSARADDSEERSQALQQICQTYWHPICAYARKRGFPLADAEDGVPVLSIDVGEAEGHTRLEPADHLSPEAVFERHWASSIVNAVMQRLRESYEIDGKAEVFEALKDSLGLGRGERSYRKIGEELGISETAARLTVHRMRKRYRQFLLQQIANTLDPEESAEEELRYLFGVFRS